MIDNFELVKPLLVFPDDDTFYKIEIMQRRKEHPNLFTGTRLLKTYYIRSMERLENLLDEIKGMCEFFGARAYIYLNPRSFEKVAFASLKQLCDCICCHDYVAAKRAYNTACGKSCNGGENKKWLFDLDEKDEEIADTIDDIVASVGGTVYAHIPTKNGIHVITSVFNIKEYELKLGVKILEHPTSHALEVIEKMDIHKDNGTILYIP